MFKAIQKIKLDRVLAKEDFTHTPRPELKIALVRHAFANISHKPQTSSQLFADWSGSQKPIFFVDYTALHWMVKRKIIKTKKIDDKTYYYI